MDRIKLYAGALLAALVMTLGVSTANAWAGDPSGDDVRFGRDESSAGCGHGPDCPIERSLAPGERRAAELAEMRAASPGRWGNG